MTGPVEEYLSQLRASLRARPAETSWILAEAEDHLRESVTAGLRAGMTEVEAQEAAVCAFGSVRAVARRTSRVISWPGEPGDAAEPVVGVEQAEVVWPGDGAGDEGEDFAAELV